MGKNKRVLSGIKSSGELTLGNYIGAMRRWASEQDEHENFYFIPDLHVLNMRSMQDNPEAVRQLTLDATAWLLACGVDPEKSTIFAQSWIHEHSELTWVLENYTHMGQLARMTQFKDKQVSTSQEAIPTALFTYPVLMTADILLYDADEVPVGEDQKQHVELARDLAERFNYMHGHTFKVPAPTLQEVGARVMNLKDPEAKMSKSDQDQSGNILLVDEPDTIRSKFKRAVTDSGDEIVARDDKPGIYNLLQINASLRDSSLQDLEAMFQNKTYKELKEDTSELVVQTLEPIQLKYRELIGDEAKLRDILDLGRKTAQPIAAEKMQQVRERVGLLI